MSDDSDIKELIREVAAVATKVETICERHQEMSGDLKDVKTKVTEISIVIAKDQQRTEELAKLIFRLQKETHPLVVKNLVDEAQERGWRARTKRWAVYVAIAGGILALPVSALGIYNILKGGTP